MNAKRLIPIVACVAIVSQPILAAAPLPARANGEDKSGGAGAPDAPNCVNTINGITGGGCSGDITLQLTAGGVINSSFGNGLRVNNTATIAGSSGVFGRQGSGAGITWAASGVWGDSNSSIGVLGTSASGWGVYGRNTSSSNAAVYGVNTSSGDGVHGESASGYGVEAISASGTGVYARGGNAVYGEGVATNATGLWGVANTGSSARGVYGSSSSGTGVVGRTTSSTGTGVEAIGNGNSTAALKITNGQIRVTGAGLDTNTPVFVHQVEEQVNTCGDPDDLYRYTFIDHPNANNNPDAIMVITFSPAFGPGLTNTSYAIAYNSSSNSFPVGNCPLNRWLIYDTNTEQEGVLTNWMRFNVLLVNP